MTFVKLIHWAFELCVFKFSNDSLFRAQHSRESYHNGLILPEWDGSLLVWDCVVVKLCFMFSLVPSAGWLSDVLVAIFTRSDKSIALTSDNAGKQWTQEKLNIGQIGTTIQSCVVPLCLL